MVGKSPALTAFTSTPMLAGLRQDSPRAAPARALADDKLHSVSEEPESKVKATIRRHGLLEPADRVLVALSGGADSSAAVLLLARLGYSLTLGHVDHAMRPGSAEDARHCRRLAARLGMPIEVVRLNEVPSTEAEARTARYRALMSMAERAGANKIVTGHTLDDQAETVRMRLDRGGFGLGMPYQRDAIVRPLLDLRRSETEAVCRRAGVVFVEDPSNRDQRFTRNRVRAALRAAGDEAVSDLIDLGERNRVMAESADEQVALLFAEEVRFDGRAAKVSRPGISRLPAHIAEGLVRRILQEMGLVPAQQLVRDVVRKVVPVTGACLDLQGGLSAWSEPEDLVVGLPGVPVQLPEVAIKPSGSTIAREWGLRIHLDIEPSSPPAYPASGLEEYFDADKLTKPLALRQHRPGDRFRPLGMGGTKKLQDFFVDSLIPRRGRHLVPLLICGNQIAWVVGHRIDDRFKVTGNTARFLRATVEPIGSGP